MSSETMPFERTAATPGDGNPSTNAKGRVYSTEQGAADKMQVADLRECVIEIMLAICLAGAEDPGKIKLVQPVPITTTITGEPPKPKPN